MRGVQEKNNFRNAEMRGNEGMREEIIDEHNKIVYIDEQLHDQITVRDYKQKLLLSSKSNLVESSY